MIRILIVDDHRLVRVGIQRMLENVMNVAVVGEAATGEEALQLVKELEPDVVLMDIRMPGIGGLEATRRIAQSGASARVLVISACEEDPFPAHAIKAGACGFLTKSASQQELIRAIRKAFVGQRYMCNEVAQQLAMRVFDNTPICPFDQLSSREMQIALMVASCYRVQDISSHLHLSPKTVNSYRYRIFEKLSVGSDVELALLAARHGVVDQYDGRELLRQPRPLSSATPYDGEEASEEEKTQANS
jgi:two-component system, NarL family, invasion response regulator UvrY